MNMDFIKPSGTDNFSIETQNENWDKAQTGFHKVAPGILAESEQGAMVTVNDSSDNPMYATLHGETKQHCEIDVTPTQSDSNVFISLIPWNKGDSIVLTLNTPRNVEYMVKREDGVIIGAAGVDSTTKQVWNYTNSDGTLGIQFYVKDATVDDVVSVQKLPSPTNEVPIYGAGKSGSISTKSTGKNTLPLTAVSREVDGINVIVDKENGIITLNGTATSDTILAIATSTIGGKFLKLNTPYIISLGKEIVTNTNVIMAVTYMRYGESGNQYPVWSTNKEEVKFTLTEDYRYLETRIKVLSGTTLSNMKVYPMIRLATETDGTYEPHTTTKADIPLSAPLYEGDYIRLNMDGTGKESHVSEEVVFDGSVDEAWGRNALSSGENPYYFINVGGNGDIVADNVKCTHLTRASVSTSNTVNGINAINSSLGYARIVMRPSAEICTDEATFRAWLAEKKPKVVYRKTKPVVTELTSEQIIELKKLHSFYHVTNATTDEGEVSFKYIADTKRYIDNKIEELQNAILVSV